MRGEEGRDIQHTQGLSLPPSVDVVLVLDEGQRLSTLMNQIVHCINNCASFRKCAIFLLKRKQYLKPIIMLKMAACAAQCTVCDVFNAAAYFNVLFEDRV